MLTKIPLSKRWLIAAPAIIAALLIAGSASALSVFDIEFPIAELGNCADKTACKAYCADPENQTACLEFANKFGINQSSAGPKTTVRDEGNQGGGINVAKAKAAIAEDGGPGQCGSFEKCGEFCGQAVNAQTCAEYGTKHDLFNGQQKEEARKVGEALRGGAKLPGGCRDRESCEKTCSDPSTLAIAKECIQFARAANLENAGDLDKAEKSLNSLDSRDNSIGNDFRKCQKPKDEATLKKCIDFAEKNGFISPEEAALVRKTGGKGPGGCFGEECRTYCNGEDHAEECQRFAEENGLVTAEQKQQREEGKQAIRNSLQNAPADVKECLTGTVGAEKIQGLLSGNGQPTQSLGSAIRQCFESSAKAMRERNDEFNQPDNEDQKPANFENNNQGQSAGDQKSRGFGNSGPGRNFPPCASEDECQAMRKKMESENGGEGSQFPTRNPGNFLRPGNENSDQSQGDAMMKGNGSVPKMRPRFMGQPGKLDDLNPEGQFNQGSNRFPGMEREEMMKKEESMPRVEMMKGQNQNFPGQSQFGPDQQGQMPRPMSGPGQSFGPNQPFPTNPDRQFSGQSSGMGNFNGQPMMGPPGGEGNFSSGNSGGMMSPPMGGSFPMSGPSGGSMPSAPSGGMPPPPGSGSMPPPPSGALPTKNFFGFLLEPFLQLFQ